MTEMPVKIYPLVLLSLLFGSSAGKAAKPYSAADGGVVAAELRYSDDFGVPMVEVSVGGGTYRFIVDTGASILCITDRVASAAGLEVKQSRYRFKNLQGKLQTARIEEFTMGNIIMHRQEAVVLSANNTIFRTLGVDGIVGGTILEHFVVSFDSRRRVISIVENVESLPEPPAVWSRFKLWRNLPLLSIGMRDGDGIIHETRALFDSGNGTGAVVIPTVKDFEKYIYKGMVSDVAEGEGVTSRMIGGLGTPSKLYRGRIAGLQLGGDTKNAVGETLNGIPVMTGGLAHPLLCWRLAEMGRIVIDYPRRRYGFTPHKDAQAWSITPYPVMTAVERGRLIVASVWDPQLRRVISPGDVIEVIGSTPISNPSETATPNIDELIPRFTTSENSTVTILDAAGVRHILPSELFLP